MTRLGRLQAETIMNGRSFFRRRSAVFFTFFFPVILIVIFGALVRTDPGSGGLFAEPPEYYVAGYLAVVVLFTPLSRVSSEVSRHREESRFEKLATTPLTRGEWLIAQTIVNAFIITVASAIILLLVVLLTGATISASPLGLVPILVGVVCFCGIGAIIGSITNSQDGAIAASNTIGLPLLFLSDTFIRPDQLPDWFSPFIELSPLTYFARSTRAAITPGIETSAIAGIEPFWGNLLILAVFAILAIAIGQFVIPSSD